MAIEDSKNRVSVRRLYALLNDRWAAIKTKFASKVDKVAGKGLSTNDFTNDAKNALQNAYTKPATGIPENDLSQDVQNKLNSAGGGYIKPEDGIPSSDMTQAVQESLTKADNSVQQVQGKGLSTNDFTNGYKQQLDGLNDALSEKVSKASTSAENNFMSFDANGNAKDSGKKADDFAKVDDIKLFQAEYGVSTFADIYAAITAKKTVYCSVPGSVANSSRMASLAYTNISDPPTSSSFIEFQYYRSNSSGTDSVFIYTITNNNDTWTTVERRDTAYQKPSGGIPKTDLADGVQNSLNSADTAMQAVGSSDSETDIDGTTKIAINVNGKNVVFSTATKLWSWLTTKLAESTTNIGGDAATASSAKSGSSLATELGQKELASNKKQSVDPTSTTDYPSSKALADYVGDAVSLAAADYISDNGEPFTSVQDLPTSTSVVSNNDYAFVTGTDQAGNTYYDRYKATVEGSTVTWSKEFRLNNSSFTVAQWNAITSGITAALVTSYNNHLANSDIHVTTNDKTAWNAKYDKPAGGIPSTDLSQGVQDLLDKVDNPEEGSLVDLAGDNEFIDVTESNGTITVSLVAETDDYEV